MSLPPANTRWLGLVLFTLVLLVVVGGWQFGTRRRMVVASGPSSTAPAATDEEELQPLTSTEGRPRLDAMAAPAPTATEDPETVLSRLRATRAGDDAEAQRLQVQQVQVLVRLGRIGEARTEAGRYYQRWPNGPDVASLEQLTGLHPVPEGER